MTTNVCEHCRMPQRADCVAGVEFVVGITPICAFPDANRDRAVENFIADEATAGRRQRCKQLPKKDHEN